MDIRPVFGQKAAMQRRTDASRPLYAAAFAGLLAVPGLIAGLEMSLTGLAVAHLGIALALAALWYGKRVRRIEPDALFWATMVFFGTYIALIATARLPGYLHPTQLNTWAFALLALGFAVWIVLTAIRNVKHTLAVLERALFLALFGVCLAQLALYWIGVEHAGKANMPQAWSLNSTLLAFDVRLNRAALPIASGVQYSAIYPALLLAVSLARFFSGSLHKIGAALALAILVLVDARGMLFAPLFALLTFAALRKFPAHTFAIVATAIPAVPVIVYKAREFSEPLIAWLFPERNSSAEMFSNRGAIWREFFNRPPDGLAALFGEGGFGQYTSGLNRSFARIFEGFTGEGQALVHMHNSYMQIAVDLGLLGLAGVCCLIYVIAYRALNAYRLYGGHPLASLLVMLLALQWIAGTEVVLTPYAREGFIAMVVLWTLAAVSVPKFAEVRARRHARTPLMR